MFRMLRRKAGHRRQIRTARALDLISIRHGQSAPRRRRSVQAERKAAANNALRCPFLGSNAEDMLIESFSFAGPVVVRQLVDLRQN
jgi:hypothetical protein